MINRNIKLLWWFVVDVFNCEHPVPTTISKQRVNREVIDNDKRNSILLDDASIKCIARVKRRMLLGSKCPDAPRFQKKKEADAPEAAVV